MHNLEILYEDNHLIALNKPAGLLTQPSGTDEESLEALVKSWIKDKYQKPGSVFLGAVHRLDKAVSGVVLFARTSKSLSRLQEAMRNRKISKTYLALIEGFLEDSEGTLTHFLIHDDHEARVVKAENPEAKKCVLHYRVLQKWKDGHVVEIDLVTGRYHQIRAQFAAIGHPIWGDRKYGAKLPYPGLGIALHHYQMSLDHPVQDTKIDVKAPLDRTLQQASSAHHGLSI